MEQRQASKMTADPDERIPGDDSEAQHVKAEACVKDDERNSTWETPGSDR